RGVYRSRDGGAKWERVLHVNNDAGAVDLVMEPTNPRVLYAGMWRVRRTPYSLESGGPGSGLWKSTDGGDTWTELTRNPGLPKGTVGIVGITVSPANPDNLYAIIEAEDGGVFRSRDGGRTWTRTNEDRSLRQRAWYYTRINADPADPEVVYVLNVGFFRSKDGGRTFTNIPVPHSDNHDLWIAPEDPRRMIEANDGGANVSNDGGLSWSTQSNQPTAQIYRVSTDTHFPYRVLGAQQDNTTLRLLSRSEGNGIGPRDWDVTAGGESGHVVADPDNPDVVYGGSYGGLLTRLDHRTGERRDINPWPDNPMGWGAAELKYRFQWNFPILFSPHDSDRLYAAANVLFQSTDEGQSWQAISPDLTRNDKSRQGPSGGPITKDNTSVEYYGTIFAVAESPLEKGVIWTGSDDGLVQVTRDGGQSWANVTPKAMPEWALINSIEAHPFEKGGLYVAATMYKSDDFRPYLFKTTDYGRTWTRIDRGIDPMHFTRVIRADPERRGLLFAGTERGVYVSFDDGGRWQPLQLNLPITPVTDLAIKEGDLIAATQGRGFWLLDDLTPLREVKPEVRNAPLHVFAPAPAYRYADLGSDEDGGGRSPGTGENPALGAVIYYTLLEAPADGREVKLEILGPDGQVIRTFSNLPRKRQAETPDAERADAEADDAAEEGVEEGEEPEEAEEPETPENEPVPAQAGLNRFVWDMTYEPGKEIPNLILWTGDPVAPRAAPGTYTVRVTAPASKDAGKDGGDVTREARFEVRKDPRSGATVEDLQAQTRFLMEIRDKLNEVHDSIRRIRDVRTQLAGMRRRLPAGAENDSVRQAARDLEKKLTAAERSFYQTRNRSSQDPLNYPIRLNDKLNGVARSAGLGDRRPTQQHLEVRDGLVTALDAELRKLEAVWTADLAAFNELARQKGVAAVIAPVSQLK
ncbi:MAG TPA: glycosyl hydrolase, partial [Thermoanaerobaculia bacterium]|nr:glycosyl hydrolase [Thermoanaerobaculia bacterium]